MRCGSHRHGWLWIRDPFRRSRVFAAEKPLHGKAAAAAEGRAFVSPLEKIRIDEGEEAYQAELEKQKKAKEAEEKKLQAMSADKRAALAQAEDKVRAELNALRKASGRPAI